MKTSSAEIENKLLEYHTLTQSYLKKLKETLSRKEQRLDYISYFTYALHLTHDSSDESFCLGSYHILNVGDHPLTNPFIHLTLSQEAPFSLHGKFVNAESSLSSSLLGGWERINDRSNRSEFQLKPIGATSIHPGEMLSFSNFQLNWKPTDSYFGNMTGIVFCDQFPEGVPALNSININGSSSIRKES